MIASDTQVGVKLLAKPAQSIHGEELFVDKLPLDRFSPTRGLCSRWRWAFPTDAKLMQGGYFRFELKGGPRETRWKVDLAGRSDSMASFRRGLTRMRFAIPWFFAQ